jgi:hypothetical protein
MAKRPYFLYSSRPERSDSSGTGLASWRRSSDSSILLPIFSSSVQCCSQSDERCVGTTRLARIGSPPSHNQLRSSRRSCEIARRAGADPASRSVRLPVGEVRLVVTIGAKSNQVFGSIIATCTARTNMVYLKAFRSSAILASPAIPL